MKSVIDVSVYILVMAIVCFISLDFIILNNDISKKQETIEYIKDYIELYGKSVEENVIEQGKGKKYRLNEETEAAVNALAQKNGMSIDIAYEDITERYYYYRMNIEYDIKMMMPDVTKRQRWVCLVKTEMEMQG